MDPTALVLIFVELLNKIDQQLPRKTSPLYKIGKFRHLLAYIGRFVFPIREPGRVYQNRESPGEIGRLERYAMAITSHPVEASNTHTKKNPKHRPNRNNIIPYILNIMYLIII